MKLSVHIQASLMIGLASLGSSMLPMPVRAGGGRTINQSATPTQQVTPRAQRSVPRASGSLPWLRTEGVRVVDDAGREVKLRGVNVEGWLMWQGPVWGAGFLPHSAIGDRLTELSSPRAVEEFRQGVYANFITEQDVIRIKEMGANVIRLPFHWRLLQEEQPPHAHRPEGWAIIDRFIDWCEKHQIYVILDLHSLPGAQSKAFVADPENVKMMFGTMKLWNNPKNLERSVELWRAIAARYAGRSAVAAYDLIAAPDPGKGKEKHLLRLYQRIIAAIREVDSAHMVILHGTNATMDLSIFPKRLDANQIYEPHQYTWFMGSKKKQVQGAEKQLKKWGKISAADQTPIWIGEFGENKYETLAKTVALYEVPENEVCGWCFWVWKRTATRYPPLVEIPMPATWERVVKWIAFPRWPNKEPSEAEAVQGMRDFVEAMKLENCRIDPRTQRLLPFRGVRR